MKEYIINILQLVIIALLCGLGAYLLRENKQRVLALLQDLIQKAEKTITGSGMGAEKKGFVLAQLESMGIKITNWVDAEIDIIVALLNERSAWYKDKVNDVVSNE